MQTTVLNFRVIISPDEQTGTGKPGFTAHCPTLGVADDGNTVEEALKNVEDAIKEYVDSLIEDNQEVPMDQPQQEFIATTSISISAPLRFA